MTAPATPREASAEMRELVADFEGQAGNYRSSGDHFDPAALDGCRHALLAAIARIEAEREALLEERYWCGCVRYARWDRCDRPGHADMDHDEEPETLAIEEARAARTPPEAPHDGR